jgi:uncharacterized membrane protein YedE/YeeE
LKRRGRGRLPIRRELRSGTTVAVVTAATIFGAAIRFAVTRGRSLDETRSAEQARRSLVGLIARLARKGVQPPLHPMFEWCMARLLGGGDFALRLADELFDRRAAIAAAIFASVAPALVWYSRSRWPVSSVRWRCCSRPS